MMRWFFQLVVNGTRGSGKMIIQKDKAAGKNLIPNNFTCKQITHKEKIYYPTDHVVG